MTHLLEDMLLQTKRRQLIRQKFRFVCLDIRNQRSMWLVSKLIGVDKSNLLKALLSGIWTFKLFKYWTKKIVITSVSGWNHRLGGKNNYFSLTPSLRGKYKKQTKSNYKSFQMVCLEIYLIAIQSPVLFSSTYLFLSSDAIFYPQRLIK